MKNNFKNVKLKNIPMAPKKCHTNVFKLSRFAERQMKIKVSFSWRISVDGRPNRRNKAAFSTEFLRPCVEGPKP